MTLQGSLVHGEAWEAARRGMKDGTAEAQPGRVTSRHLRAVNDCHEIVFPGKSNHSLQAEPVKQHGSVHCTRRQPPSLQTSTQEDHIPHYRASILATLTAHYSDASDARVVL